MSSSLEEFEYSWVFFTMIDLSDQLALTELVKLKACGAYIARREQQWLVRFLIALHNDFKGLKGSILHRSPLSSVDSVVNKLLIEEIYFQSYFKKEIISTYNPYVLSVLSKVLFNNQNKSFTRVAFDECNLYK